MRDRGDEAGTEAAWQTAAELGSGEGAYNLAHLLAEQGDIEGARRALKMAIDSGHEEAAARATRDLAELAVRE